MPQPVLMQRVSQLRHAQAFALRWFIASHDLTLCLQQQQLTTTTQHFTCTGCHKSTKAAASLTVHLIYTMHGQRQPTWATNCLAMLTPVLESEVSTRLLALGYVVLAPTNSTCE